MKIAIRLVALAAILALTGAAHSAPLKAGFFNITQMEMVPNNADTDYAVDWAGDGLQSHSAGTRCFSTGVHLPHGATITNVIARYRSGPVTTASVVLNRHRLVDGSLSTIGGKILDDDTRQMKSAVFGPDAAMARVDNIHYAYSLGVCLGGSAGDSFYSARVRYTYVD